MPVVHSKITSKSQTVIPREVRARLGLKPGDRLRYIITETSVMIERANGAEEDPFAVFTEWGSAADDEAYGKL